MCELLSPPVAKPDLSDVWLLALKNIALSSFCTESDEVFLRKCKVCQMTKPIHEFVRDVSRPSGYRYQCRKCARKQQRELEQRKKQ